LSCSSGDKAVHIKSWNCVGESLIASNECMFKLAEGPAAVSGEQPKSKNPKMAVVQQWALNN
jgi:hypothetical protein